MSNELQPEAPSDALADFRRLQEISTRLIGEDDLETLLREILDAAIEITRADLGNIQLVSKPSGVLKIVTQRGFDREFLDFFNSVHQGMAACGTAAQAAQRVIVEDAVNDPIFKGTPACEIMINAGALAVQSTPLVSRVGELLGMFSTHWRTPHCPSERDLNLLDVLARQAADLIERTRAVQDAQRLAAIVDSSQDAIVSKDLNGIILTWNRGAERLFGYSADEVIGRPVTILIPEDRRDEGPGILGRIRLGEVIEHYDTVRRRKDGTLVDISLSVSPLKDGFGRVIGVSKISRDITETKLAQARQDLLTQEISHRTRNLLAVVHSVVARSFAGKRTLQEAEAAVLSRLHSLAETHTMLIDKDWHGADLVEVIRKEMAPYSGRIAIHGPPVLLGAKPAQNFALAVHELATNAAKYGALSNATGLVRITWHVDDSKTALNFRWEESAGPRVVVPNRKGFGSAVLEQVMADYCDDQPKVEFQERGVTYDVTCLLAAIAPNSSAGGSDAATSDPS